MPSILLAADRLLMCIRHLLEFGTNQNRRSEKSRLSVFLTESRYDAKYFYSRGHTFAAMVSVSSTFRAAKSR